ncbi:MAG: SUMF1/EgtB/PvdO family nonheme iron enzyme, partial [Planctomycetaceae bacterium]|nr:SUMF1/EgtB/PvdO family nonheme iron enzyme [Planctomycetaceae bacterium]
AVFYEMLTGRPPFLAATVTDTLYQICLHAPLRLRLLQPSLPKDLEVIALKCLQKDPAARYRTAQELAEDLHRFRHHQPVRARRVGQLEKMTLWRRRHPTVAALLLMVCLAIVLSGVLLTRQYRSTFTALQRIEAAQQSRTAILLDNLRTADANAFLFSLDALRPQWQALKPRLTAALRDGRLTAAGQTRFRLALVADEPDLLNAIRECLWSAEPREMELIARVLERQKAFWPADVWSAHTDAVRRRSEDAAVPQNQRLRPVSLLAFHGVSVNRTAAGWKVVTEQLLSSDSLNLPMLTRLLRPAAKQLLPSLVEALTDASITDEQRYRAAGILANYAQNEREWLEAGVLSAAPAEFPVFVASLRAFGDVVVADMEKRLEAIPPADDRTSRETQWRQLTNAALMLLNMGATEHVWPLLAHSPDPTLRSRLISRMAGAGVDWRLPADQFRRESSVSIRRALLLAVGGFDPSRLSEMQTSSWLTEVESVFQHDADCGIHASCEWHLRQWNHPIPEIAAADVPIEDAVAGRRDWFVNSQGQTFSVIRGPLTVKMGSPDDEPLREWIEVPHDIRIDRTFAISAKEVTRGEYQRFDPSGGGTAAAEPVSQCPACQMNWFDAAKYCRWLSEQEGIPEDQMCYPSADQICEGLTPYPDYLHRTGYRLPTEAELECAARAGAVTQFCCGDSEDLLHEYAWYVRNSEALRHPTGLLKPNDLGLFDVHGNVSEWGQEWIVHSSAESKTLRDEDVEDVTRVVNVGHYRIKRGGAFNGFPGTCRCAFRVKSPPLSASSVIGIRLARTLPAAEWGQSREICCRADDKIHVPAHTTTSRSQD